MQIELPAQLLLTFEDLQVALVWCELSDRYSDIPAVLMMVSGHLEGTVLEPSHLPSPLKFKGASRMFAACCSEG